MVTFYIIRHCEAAGNATRTFQGSTDTDITPLGRRQLEALHRRFEDIPLDTVYSSPLCRAFKTAQAVTFGKGIPIIKEDGLTEISGGAIENMSFPDIYKKYPGIEYIWQCSPQDFAAPQGETMRSVYDRIWKTVKKIAADNCGKTVAAATHGAAIRCLVCRVLKGDIEKLNEIPWSDNTAVTKLIFDDELNCSAEFVNDTSHLSDDLIPEAHRISAAIGEIK